MRKVHPILVARGATPLPTLLSIALVLSACADSGSAGGSSTAGPSTAQEEPASPGVVPALNGRVIEQGLVFSGQPSEEEIRELARRGTRVLDLRRPEEDRGFDQAALAAEVGLVYRNVPVDAAALTDPSVHAAFREAMEATDDDVLVHCASGNRVAGLYYGYLVSHRGLEREAAHRRAVEAGLTSPAVREAVDGYLDGLDSPTGDA